MPLPAPEFDLKKFLKFKLANFLDPAPLGCAVKHDCLLGPAVKAHARHLRHSIVCHDSKGNPIREALYFYKDGLPYLSFRNMPEPVARIDKACIYAHASLTGYGHFIIEGLARLWYASIRKMPLVWLSPGGLTPLQKDILEFLDIRTEHIFVDKPTLFKKTYFPWPGVTMGLYFNKFHADFCGKLEHRVKTGKKVFISRKRLSPACGGHCQDDAALEDLVLKYGFQIIYPEQLPFQKQISELAEAEMALGVESSAFHSAIFLKDPVKTRFIALARHRNGTGIFENIRKVKNLDYQTINIKKETGPICANEGITLNFTLLEQMLKTNFSHSSVRPYLCQSPPSGLTRVNFRTLINNCMPQNAE